MKLSWYGHSCFLAETAEGSAVFDPYSPGSVPGWTLPELTADAVVCSHEHRDHNYRAGVKLSGLAPRFRLRQIPSWHDERGGALRGENSIAVLEAEGLRLVHLGDLGHLLNEEQLAAIGRPDVLLIPVGGHFTIDGALAAETAKAIDARVTVPMHYRGEDFGYGVISTNERFLSLMGPDIRYLTGNELTVTSETPKGVYVPGKAR